MNGAIIKNKHLITKLMTNKRRFPVGYVRNTMATDTITLPQAVRQLNWANRRCKFAWAQYYTVLNEAHNRDRANYLLITHRIVNEDSIPTHIKTMLIEMAKELKKKWECPICIEFIDDGNMEITNCGHFYCKGCLGQVKARAQQAHQEKWECGVCRKKHGFTE